MTKHIILKADSTKSDDKPLYITPTNNIEYDTVEDSDWWEMIEAEIDINKMPKDIQQFAETWQERLDFSIDVSKCVNSPFVYYIKKAEVTFKYEDKWYKFTQIILI